MKTKVHPAVAALILIVVVCAAGYWMWASNQDAPVPDKFISPSEQRKLYEMGGAAGKGQAPAAKPDQKGTGTAKANEKAAAPTKP